MYVSISKTPLINLYTESSQERIKGLSSLGEVWYTLMPTLINKGAFYSF